MGKRDQRTARCASSLSMERARGKDRIDFYRQFAENVRALSDEMRKILYDLKAQGKRIAAYGAAAKVRRC